MFLWTIANEIPVGWNCARQPLLCDLKNLNNRKGKEIIPLRHREPSALIGHSGNGKDCLVYMLKGFLALSSVTGLFSS